MIWRCYCRAFCFFKQKTAYEMRISDWSSDVCSSDLSAGLATPWSSQLAICCEEMRSVARSSISPMSWMSEIGRESCRERVCQVRVDLGGRRIIQQQKVTTQKERSSRHQQRTTASIHTTTELNYNLMNTTQKQQ